MLSDTELSFGSEVADFVREHIGKICAGDDAKECRFYEKESEVYQLLTGYDDEDFVAVSREIAGLLYEIMAANIDIPSADLMAVRFREGGGISGPPQTQFQSALHAQNDAARGGGGQQQRADPP